MKGLPKRNRIDSKIQSIKDELDKIQKNDAPKVKYNDEAHGLIESSETDKLIGEQPVKAKMIMTWLLFLWRFSDTKVSKQSLLSEMLT